MKRIWTRKFEGLSSKWRSGAFLHALPTSCVSVVLLSSAIAIPGAMRYPEPSDRPASSGWQLPGEIVPKRPLIAAGDFVLAHSSPAQQTNESLPGGARVAGVTEIPMVEMVTELAMASAPAARPGQLLIADLMTYGGKMPTIEAPVGWELIRDDISATTRQSLYAHFASSSDQTSTWKFSQPVDAQGVILAIDNAAANDPISASNGMAGMVGSDYVRAPTVTTSEDGDLILLLFATDFGGIAPNPDLPYNTSEIVNQKSASHAYWILGSYQMTHGETEEADCASGQLYNEAAAQLAIKRR